MTKKKLTIKDLINEKEKYIRNQDEKKELDIYLDQLGATVTIVEPENSMVIESVEIGRDEEQESNGDDFLVYNVMKEPNLKDAELQKAYGCVEPTDIVHKLFSPGTISGIATQAMDLAGYSDKVTRVDKLKN